MAKESQEERARRIKNEREEREIKNELSRDLKRVEKKRRAQKFRNKHRNRYEDMTVLFITTLIVGYIIFFMMQYAFNFLFGTAVAILGVSLEFIYPFFHAAIWIIAILSAYKRRSVLDDILDRFI